MTQIFTLFDWESRRQIHLSSHPTPPCWHCYLYSAFSTLLPSNFHSTFAAGFWRARTCVICIGKVSCGEKKTLFFSACVWLCVCMSHHRIHTGRTTYSTNTGHWSFVLNFLARGTFSFAICAIKLSTTLVYTFLRVRKWKIEKLEVKTLLSLQIFLQSMNFIRKFLLFFEK